MRLELEIKGRRIDKDIDLPPAGWRGLILICPPLLDTLEWCVATLRYNGAGKALWDVEERGTSSWKARGLAAKAWLDFPDASGAVPGQKKHRRSPMRLKRHDIETMEDLPAVGWRGLIMLSIDCNPTDAEEWRYRVATLRQAEGCPPRWEVEASTGYTLGWDKALSWYEPVPDGLDSRQGSALPGAPPGGGEPPAHMQRSELTEEAFREWFPTWVLPSGATSTGLLYLLDSALAPTHTIGFYDENGRSEHRKGKLHLEGQWRPFAAVEQYALLLLHLARNNGQLPTWMKGDDNAVDQD